MSDRRSQADFMSLFAECERQLLGYILVMVPQYQDALDVLQEAAAAMWEKFDTYEDIGPFVVWARKFAHIQVHRFRDRQRHRNWMLQPLGEEVADALGQAYESHEGVLELRREALSECLKKLTSQELDLLRQRYWSTGSLRDVASSLGLSEDQIYRRLQKIRQLLQECINKAMAELGAS